MCKSTNQAATNGPTNVRLQNSWVPSVYDVKLLCKLGDWSTEVVETITFLKSDPEAKIEGGGVSVLVHAGKGIRIASVTGAEALDAVGHPNTAATISAKVEMDYRTHEGASNALAETIRFKVTGLPEDALQFRFTVHFHNCMQEELRGLYRCQYTDSTGKAQRMASTHFEPMGARLCYICLDEPAARATFRLTVALPVEDEHLTVISNSPLKTAPAKFVHADLADGKTAFETRAFADIERCPPYLTALVVGDLEFISATSAAHADGTAGTPLRFFTTKGKKDQALYSLQCAVAALEYFEKFFHSRFPLPKLDLVAVPDFPIGGMENWGCITLVETCLVGPEENAGVSVLKRVCNLVSHEVSHNWFGNLVGIDWWEGLWLKEGFASWCGYQGTENFRPTFGAIADATSEVFGALATDGHQASHPVEVPILDPADITQVFDSISYSKGMGVVNMLEHYLGAENFSKGIAAYVNTYQYRNTKTPQLWEEIEKATKVPIAAMMNSFTTQQGFPVVSVSVAGAATSIAEVTQLTLSQRPFAYAGNDSSAFSGSLWSVPLRIEVRNTATNETLVDFKAILTSKSDTITLPALPKVLPEHASSLAIIVNPGGGFYYRTLYKSDLLLSNIWSNYAALPEPHRKAILNDLSALYLSGEIPVEFLIKQIAMAVDNEQDHSILCSLVNICNELRHTVIHPDVCKQLELTSPHQDDEEQVENLSAKVNKRFYQLALDLFEKDKTSMAPETKMLRQAAVVRALRYETNEVANERLAREDAVLSAWAEKSAETFLSTCTPELKGKPGFAVVPDFDTLGACIGAAMVSRTSTKYHAHFVWDAYKLLDTEPQKGNLVLSALCHYGDDRGLLTDIAKLCTRNSVIRSQLGAVVFMGLTHNDFFDRFAWEHIKADWDAIYSQWGNGQFALQRIIEHLAQNTDALNSVEDAVEFEEFFKSHPCPAAILAIRRGVERIKLKALLSKRDAAAFYCAI